MSGHLLSHSNSFGFEMEKDTAGCRAYHLNYIVGGLFANCTYTISCYIIAVQEVVAVKEQKYYLYLSDDEYRQTIQSLVHLKNNLIAQGRCTDGVDDVLCKVLSAKKRKFKIKYF